MILCTISHQYAVDTQYVFVSFFYPRLTQFTFFRSGVRASGDSRVSTIIICSGDHLHAAIDSLMDPYEVSLPRDHFLSSTGVATFARFSSWTSRAHKQPAASFPCIYAFVCKARS